MASPSSVYLSILLIFVASFICVHALEGRNHCNCLYDTDCQNPAGPTSTCSPTQNCVGQCVFGRCVLLNSCPHNPQCNCDSYLDCRARLFSPSYVSACEQSDTCHGRCNGDVCDLAGWQIPGTNLVAACQG